MTEAFDFTPLIGVVAMMGDKDVRGVLEIFAEAMTTVVVTGMTSTGRALTPSALGEIAGEVFGQLNRWSGRHSGVLIYEVEATRPRSVPDPDTSMPRYLLTASGTSRLHTP